jgi:hypothetical protein
MDSDTARLVIESGKPLGARKHALRKVTYVFRCPVCCKEFETDEPGEPCCTGPNESSDDHPHEVMRLARVHRRYVGAHYAERRAGGPLLMLGGLLEDRIEHEAKLLLSK